MSRYSEPISYYSGNREYARECDCHNLGGFFWFVGFPILALSGLMGVAHVLNRPGLQLKLVRFKTPCQGYNVMARVSYRRVNDQRITFRNLHGLITHGYDISSLKEIHDGIFNSTNRWITVGKIMTEKGPKEIRRDLKKCDVRADFICEYDSEFSPLQGEFTRRQTVFLDLRVKDELR